MEKFILPMLLLNVLQSISCERSSFGDFCNSTLRCDSRQSLTCKNEICQCLVEKTMIFDTELNKCGVLAGEKCSYTAGEVQKENFECVSNSECISNYNFYNEEFICVCQFGFYKASNGTCILKSTFNETCEDDVQCQSWRYLELECVDGSCACRNGAAFNSESKKCVQFYNGTCHEREDLCVPNAYCDSLYSQCFCRNGFSHVSIGHCHAEAGTSCGINLPCNSEKGLICVDGKCQCEFSKHQYVENSNCKSLVWGPCSGTFSCTDNAECSEVTSGVNVCLCKEGFVPVDRKCELAYGQACDNSVPCDRGAPLSCIEGTCKCSGYQYYDEEEMKCKGLFGAVCEVNKKGFCTGGTFCKPFRGFELINFGICTCPEGFAANKDRKFCSELKLKPTPSKV